jgi:ankyrin repeat protein
LVRALLGAGAGVDVTDKNGGTLLHSAAGSGKDW